MNGRIKNIVTAVILSLILAFFSVKAMSKSLEAMFIGNEAFWIKDGGYSLFTDFPYTSGVYNSMTYDFNFKAVTGKVLALVSHRHKDHFDPVLFVYQNWKIVGPREVTIQLPPDRVVKFGPEITFGPIRIIPRKSPHANTEHYSYLVEWAGRKLFFTGDTEDINTLKNLPKLDALFITPWFYRKAKMANALPTTRKVIIYHHMKGDIIPDCSGCIIPIQNQVIDIKASEVRKHGN
ncbi:MAG: MBL fold metallo-hydrolase [Alphaproteobacteria bacterium]|nr:MBL fold metallo-hydrolase [Alphaproteobacteria bacterium]